MTPTTDEYVCYDTLDEARGDPEAYAVLMGDCGGNLLAVVPVKSVKCSQEALETAAMEMDVAINGRMYYPGDDPDDGDKPVPMHEVDYERPYQGRLGAADTSVVAPVDLWVRRSAWAEPFAAVVEGRATSMGFDLDALETQHLEALKRLADRIRGEEAP